MEGKGVGGGRKEKKKMKVRGGFYSRKLSCHIASCRRQRLQADAARRLFLSSSSSWFVSLGFSSAQFFSPSPDRNPAARLVATLSRLNTSFSSRNPPTERERERVRTSSR